ncbi:hypothetical protein CEXT_337451 [Caerostris extrusa]|uniref:Uncharacterized protein n=1 Tax=Caerostris extrusa TaxID=172846 RepID=A0AAV4N0J1_CAEEX|nr:hypothetical protein CEXT_337451 [Caerostris extrusa]
MGARTHGVNASLKRSSLWSEIHILRLTVNLRIRVFAVIHMLKNFSDVSLKLYQNRSQVKLPETLWQDCSYNRGNYLFSVRICCINVASTEFLATLPGFSPLSKNFNFRTSDLAEICAILLVLQKWRSLDHFQTNSSNFH